MGGVKLGDRGFVADQGFVPGRCTPTLPPLRFACSQHLARPHPNPILNFSKKIFRRFDKFDSKGGIAGGPNVTTTRPPPTPGEEVEVMVGVGM